MHGDLQIKTTVMTISIVTYELSHFSGNCQSDKKWQTIVAIIPIVTKGGCQWHVPHIL